MLLALRGVDGQDFIRKAGLFQDQRDLQEIGRRMEVEADHGLLIG